MVLMFTGGSIVHQGDGGLDHILAPDAQMEKVATGFEHAHGIMAAAFEACRSKLSAVQR